MKVVTFRQYGRQLRQDFRQTISKLLCEQGDNFQFKSPFITLHVIADPKAIKRILFDNLANYSRPDNFVLDPVTSFGPPGRERDIAWAEIKSKIWNPLMKESSIKGFTEAMQQNVTEYMQSWDSIADKNIPVNIYLEMEKITLNNLIKSVFGGVKLNTSNSEIMDIIHEFIPLAFSYEANMTKLSWMLPTATRRRTINIQNRIIALSNEIVEKCTAPEAPQDNFINRFAKAYEKENSLTEAKFKRLLQVVASKFIMAGYETSAMSLATIFADLSIFPLVVKNIRDEIDAQLGSDPINHNNIDKLVYTRAVVMECLRFQGGLVREIYRKALDDDKIDADLTIKKNDRVLIPVFHLNQDRRYWENPQGFDPERFLKPLDPGYNFIYLPFSAGPRTCGGRNLAIIENVILLATILRKYSFDLTQFQKVHFDQSKKIMVTIRKHESPTNLTTV